MYLYGVSCVGITDSSGRIIGNLSAADFRVFKPAYLMTLLTPVSSFIQSLHGKNPSEFNLVVGPQSKIENVVDGMMKKKVHRAWVCTEDGKPMGVVTMSDIIGGVWAAVQ